jgi:FtsP/CotA-like multicopper oxidase with cupredoxin domain
VKTPDHGRAGRRLLGRRDVLQLGAAAFAAGTLPGLSLGSQTPGSGQGQKPPQPPSLDSVADPAAAPVEDWTEPWVWRPSEWPDQPLALNVVGNAHPPRATSPGNRFAPLYSFNGSSPGPTIRMRGDETLRITLRNLLPGNMGQVPKGPAPDPFEIRPKAFESVMCAIQRADGLDCAADPPPARRVFKNFNQFFRQIPVPLVNTSCVSGSVNVPHGSHTTNLHTHGIHVEPGTNLNGTFGDEVMARVLPRGDWDVRQRADEASCRALEPHERVAEAKYEYAIGNVQRAARRRTGRKPQPHPPGTHWYHPHAHGATNDQVASGLAGFLIVEGDVDDAINKAMTGTDRPDPTVKTGPFDYRERLMLVQRVEVSSLDVDAGPHHMGSRLPPPTAINGTFQPTTIFMRPGAVERWRVINASVDGRGTKNFMVLEGQFVFSDRQLWKVLPPQGGAARRLEPATREDVANATRQLYQLSFDGITLVEVDNGRARYTIKDLSRQNPGTTNAFDRQPAPGEDPTRVALRNVEDCYRDADSLRNLYVRPNQVLLSNANRTDLFFKAPVNAAGKVYTVFAQEFILQTDNFQQRLQIGIASGKSGFSSANPAPIDVVVGYIKVDGEPVRGGDFDVMSLRDRLPDVPEFLRPVDDEELRVSPGEAARRKVPAGSYRTRVLSYSGYGPVDFPLVETPEAFTREHPELRGRVWDEIDGTRVLLTPFSRTMAISGDFDLAANPDPPAAQKFSHHDHNHPKVLVDTSEEWVLHNCSISLWSHTDTKRFKQAGQYNTHYRAYPITRAEGQERFQKDPEFQITTKGADHPFHIHVNPCWVTRIEVPDERGRLHNILEAPRWMDTVAIPRGGRVVFRSRFADYVGTWVNHCHILMHEDHGMMQAVSAVARAEDANARPRSRVASSTMSAGEVNAIYPPPSLELMYRQNMRFVDSNPELGQVYPGFDVEAPKLPKPSSS